MVKLAEYSRTATFAWSHDRIPSLVTGTASGTVDANFSNESVLELWSLLSTDSKKPVASLSTDAKFNDLDWSVDNKIIAGALENGSLEFFNVNEKHTDLKSIGKFNAHKSSVRTLKFNPKQSNVLASGDNSGEILIWDTNKSINSNKNAIVQDYTPLKPGTAMTSIEEIHSLAWNQSLAHVFASTGSSSFASVWDLKAKKEVIHLSFTSPTTGLKPQLSVVEWHPSNSTRLVTATGSDTEPTIIIWDLRNANTPLNLLTGGHSKGILSLDWCKQDENLLLSSGRDNSVVLWNPTTGEELSQFPPHSNWSFKTKFAPQAPDIFATASFDSKIEIQTLQNLVNEFDKEETVTQQQESETDFWNHVSEKDSNEKPNILKIQAPSWYGNKSPAAQWAFGGKLVQISKDGKSVTITKPKIQGLEQNILLNEALKTKDYKPLINVRLVKGIDKTNDEDWNLLDKLSLDGRDEFLRDTFAFDDDSEELEINNEKIDQNIENTLEGEEFFEKIENNFQPKDEFKLNNDTELSITRKLIAGNKKAAITETLKNGLLLESLIIALDSNDESLKSLVKNTYFSEYGNKASLSRILYSYSNNNIEDMVENLDIAQWKYIVKSINSTYNNDLENKKLLLIRLGDRLLKAGERQDALALYLAANSVDKVASVWLKELAGLEDILKKDNKTVYEAHSECLTEFVERFTVFSSFVGPTTITNNALIAKFLEFVDIASASGDFELASSFLDILPKDNNEVIAEKERVLLASGKPIATSKATTSTATGSRYRAPTTHAPSRQMSFGMPSTVPPTMPVQTTPMPVTSMPAPTSGIYAPPPQPMQPVQPVAIQTQQNIPASSRANPYAPPNVTASVAAATPSASFIAPTSQYGSQPFTHGQEPNEISPPPQSGVLSGQKPHLNRKANDGWNDLPLNVKDNKPSRAKPVSVAPVNVGLPSSAPSHHGQGGTMPPTTLSRVSSTVSIPPPTGSKRKESLAKVDESTVPQAAKPSNNPYAPQNNTQSLPPQPNNIYSTAQPNMQTSIPQPVNPYAPSASATSPPPVNQYAPNASMTSLPPQQPISTMPQPINPYANTASIPNNSNGPFMNATPPPQQQAPKPVAGPPPMSSKRKSQHRSKNVENANSLLEAVQKAPSTVDISTPPQQPTQPVPPSVASPSPTQQIPVPTPAAAPIAPPQQSSAAAAAAAPTSTSASAVNIPEDQQAIVDFLKSELDRVAPLTPKEYSKQLKDCDKRLKILYQHLEKQDLLTQATIEKLKELVEYLKTKNYSAAMEVHVYIATHHAQEGGNWLTGVKRLIGIAEATSS